MKIIAYIESNLEESFGDVMNKYAEKRKKIREEREKFPDKYPKHISPGYNVGVIGKGIHLYEVENEDQIINLTLFWKPELKFEWKPLFESAKVFELYEKMKQK